MGFNLIVLLLIVLTTLYLSTQGMLSSLIALVTAVFSSILAMALMEPLQGLIGSWRPEYARGITFLLLFFLAFSATRIVADIAVPGNIKVSLWVNRGAGAAMGLLASLVVVGNLVIGIEMLPLPRALLGYDRFPGDAAMQSMDSDNKPVYGEVSKLQSGVWFNPDRFVLAIWNGASGRALGGNRPWSSVHPDLSVESYGYRNSVAKGSMRTVPADLFKVTDAWMTTDPAYGIKPDSGKRLVMIRAQVSKGDKETHDTADPNEAFFRVSATQVRLVTDKARPYYPIGYLERGTRFVPFTLDSGYMVDDYVKNQVNEDWIFQINDDERPALFEMKQMGRAELGGVIKDKVGLALRGSDYPQHGYLRDVCTVDVQFNSDGKPILDAEVYVVQSTVQKRQVVSEINSAYAGLERINSSMNSGAGGWSSTDGKPGVPARGLISQAYSVGTNMKDSALDDSLQWSQVVPVLLAGQAQADGEANLRTYPQYFDSLTKVWTALGSGRADESGKVKLDNIQPGSRAIIATLRTEHGFFVWLLSEEFKAATHVSKTLSVSGGGEGPIFRIDLDAKQPGG